MWKTPIKTAIRDHLDYLASLKRIVKFHLGVAPHVLRLRGMDLDALAELMGHECLETTRIYATLANDELQKRCHECGLLIIPAQQSQVPSPLARPDTMAGPDIERIHRRLRTKRPH